MHLNDVRKMQDEKDFLMRHEGKHPANYPDHFGGDHGVEYSSHGVEMQ